MEINIGMTREGLLNLAEEINRQCDEHPSDEGIEVTRYIPHNGNGPELTLVLNNDDMEGDHITSPTAACWDGDL